MNRPRSFFRSLTPAVQALAAGAFAVVANVLVFAALGHETRRSTVLSGAVGASAAVYVAELLRRRA